MSTQEVEANETSARFDAALAEYMERCDLGETIDRAEFLNKYPDLREDLTRFFQLADNLATSQLGKVLEGGRQPKTRPAAAPASPPLKSTATATTQRPTPGRSGYDAAPRRATKYGARVPAEKLSSEPKQVTKPEPKATKPKEALSKDNKSKETAAEENSVNEKNPRRWGSLSGLVLALQLLAQNTPAWLVSTLVHVAVVVSLAVVTIVPQLETTPLYLTANGKQEELLQLTELDEPEIEVQDDSASAPQMEALNATDMIAVTGLNTGPQMAVELSSDSFNEGMLTDVSHLFGGGGKSGDGDGMDGLGKTAFFGQGSAGRKIAFIIDNSGSMSHGRFETALYELQKAVNGLTPKQQFFVVFFSDTAYPMFHPKADGQFVAATEQNKERLAEWLNTVEVSTGTKAHKALEGVFSMRPDVIYLLGDGAFTDDTSKYLNELTELPTAPIHVIGMQVGAKEAAVFKSIADRFRGNYHDAGVHPEMAEVAKKNPRKFHKVRGPIWGITLKP